MSERMPTRLAKEPIIEAIWELRFESRVRSVGDVLPGLVYKELGAKYPRWTRTLSWRQLGEIAESVFMTTRTYVDSNVLLAAFRASEPWASSCLAVLDDPRRTLAVSEFVRLEVLPKPSFFKREEEVRFMAPVLDAAENIDASYELVQLAFEFACKYGLGSMDALHAAAAHVARVDELVTLEKPIKPLCRLREINVVSLYRLP